MSGFHRSILMRLGPRALGLAVAASAVWAGACGAPPRAGVRVAEGVLGPFGLDAGSGAAGSELLLPGPLASAGGGAEQDRRDAGLNVRPELPLSATRQWPEAPRPSVERRVYIALPHHPRTTLLFREREREVRIYDRRY